MSNKPVAIVLGGTYPHKSLLQQLKQRGYYTILVDYLEYSPAMENADEHIRENTLDKEKVLEVAKSKDAKLVISTCIDQANVTACYVGEKLALPIPYSYETALLVSNKVLMKKRMMESSIPTAKYREFSNLSLIDDKGLVYPLIVKPSDSNSSKGVRKVENKSELFKAAKLAIEISRDSKVLVEEYLNSIEIGVDCFISGDEISIIMTRERRKISNQVSAVQQIKGSVWPAKLNQKQLNNIQDVVSAIVSSFELDNTLLMMQAILVDNDVYVIEFAPRIGGGENYKIIEYLTGCNVIDLAIDSFLNQPRKAIYHNPKRICADIYLYAMPGVFDRIVGFDEIKKSEYIMYWCQYKQKGYQIKKEISSNNRIGAFVLEGYSEDEINKQIVKIINEISIINKNGVDVLYRNLYS